MDDLYTRNGRPLQLTGDQLHSRSGHYLGHVRHGKAFDPTGRYCGTVIGNRVVYRSIDSASTSSPTTAADRTASTRANQARSSLWGHEPPFED